MIEASPAPRTSFDLPRARAAAEPAEARGLGRDDVRLLVATPRGIYQRRFADLGAFLRPGDLVVVNTSATLAAAIDARRFGKPVVVHLSAERDDATWVVELRAPDGSAPVLDGAPGETIELPAGGLLTLLGPEGGPVVRAGVRLWRARASVAGRVQAFLSQHGRPIDYGYLRRRWDISSYQTIFGREPGSAEMPGAGRPFTHALVTELVTRGVLLAPVVLHAGVSSLEAGESPPAERFRVPGPTADVVNHTRERGGRVVAIGTTVTRALETAVEPDGTVAAGQGWTELVLGPERPAQVVGGLVTGWHPPQASHLLLLEAVAGPRLVQRAYDAALARGYLWHEFGDSCLLLPTHPGG